MQRLTDEQWNLYLKKYEKLIWTISKKISGDDTVTSSLEDNHADLCLAALQSINGFEKLTGKAFNEAFGTKLFDQYTKTVLWNHKAKKGIPLTKRMEFRSSHRSLDFEYTASDGDSSTLSDKLEDRKASLDLSAVITRGMFEDDNEDVKKVVNAIIKDPSVVNSNGKLVYSSLIEPTGLTLHFVEKAVDKIKILLQKEFRDE